MFSLKAVESHRKRSLSRRTPELTAPGIPFAPVTNTYNNKSLKLSHRGPHTHPTISSIKSEQTCLPQETAAKRTTVAPCSSAAKRKSSLSLHSARRPNRTVRAALLDRHGGRRSVRSVAGSSQRRGFGRLLFLVVTEATVVVGRRQALALAGAVDVAVGLLAPVWERVPPRAK